MSCSIGISNASWREPSFFSQRLLCRKPDSQRNSRRSTVLVLELQSEWGLPVVLILKPSKLSSAPAADREFNISRGTPVLEMKSDKEMNGLFPEIVQRS